MDDFAQATAQDYQDCLTHPRQMTNTRLGPVEFAIRGEGPPILAVHGGPGGCDQGLALAECFRKNGFTIIAPSRPGYLGTPLGQGTTAEAQAEVLAALIEDLNVGPLPVVAASAGGPPSYALAQNRPDLVRALVAIDAVAITYTKQDELTKTQEAIFLSKPGLWLMDWFMRHFPAPMVKEFLKNASSLDDHELLKRVRQVVSDPAKLGFVRVMTKTMCDGWDERKQGVYNDLALMGALKKMPLDNVACPALIAHGDADADVTPAHGQYAHGAINGSEFYSIKGGSHIGFWIADSALEAQRHALGWLRRQLRPA